MKYLLGVLATVHFGVLAAWGSGLGSFAWDGSAGTQQAQLSSSISHTEYRPETRESTCYRTEYAGQDCGYVNETYCRNVGNCLDMTLLTAQSQVQVPVTEGPARGDGPRGGGGHGGGGGGHGGGSGGGHGGGYGCHQECETRANYVCHDRYRQVAYTCYETVQVPYTVKDSDVVANVQVNFKAVNGIQPGAKVQQVNVTLNGAQVQLSGSSPDRSLILLGAVTAQTEDGRGTPLVTVNAQVDVSGVTPAEVKALIDIQDLAVNSGNILTFTAGTPEDGLSALKYLEVRKNRFLIKKKELIARFLNDAELKTEILSSGRTKFTVDLKSLNLDDDLTSGTFDVKITLSLQSTNVLSASDFPSFADEFRNALEIKLSR